MEKADGGSESGNWSFPRWPWYW